jgi:hypothetical protein
MLSSGAWMRMILMIQHLTPTLGLMSTSSGVLISLKAVRLPESDLPSARQMNLFQEAKTEEARKEEVC